MKTYIYIDGFNLYYGAVKNTPYKWLDLLALCERLFPDNEIAKIKYFTARVKATRHDPEKPARQEIYLRALRRHIPHFEIIEGYFLQSQKSFPLAYDLGYVVFNKREEKGSDVNLAVHLLNDAWKKRFQAAVVVSNDSDLAEAIRLANRETGCPIGVCNPNIREKKMAVELNKAASFRERIAKVDLQTCQLPDPIPGTKIRKPDAWR